MLPRSIQRTLFAVLVLLAASPLSAQTISGRLLDRETNQPIDLGLVIMFTESGDSVTAALTNPGGHFSISSPEPGSFLLLGSAFGYRETPAGVFELGDDGAMTIEFRLEPEPLALDGLLVGVEGRVFEHHLLENGFVRRFQRGLGHFITPHDLDNSVAKATEALFEDIPGMMVTVPRAPNGLPLSHLGDKVLMRSGAGGVCAPVIYIDGMNTHYAADEGVTLSHMVPLAAIEAVEVYRRPAEVPVEYAVTQGGAVPVGGPVDAGACGVLVFWTKLGPRSGRLPRRAESEPTPAEIMASRSAPRSLETGEPPSAGERIRMALDPEIAAALGLGPVWEARFLSVREGELVGSDESTGRPVAVPMQGVEMLQVERDRPFKYAVRRGVIAGSVFGVGSWLMLRVLCGPSCSENDEAALPAALIGLFSGALVGSQGPGTHWVDAPLPEGGGNDSESR